MVLGTKSALDKQQIQTLSLISQTDIPTQKLKNIIYENFYVNESLYAIAWGSQKKCEQGVCFFYSTISIRNNVTLLSGLCIFL